MEYLASRKLIHRDLATRNILLTSDNIVKICDFGLTKDSDYLYSRRSEKKNTPLPIRWMAPEAIGQNIFNVKSDVWSFGVVLWEMFSLGVVPYAGVEINNAFYKSLLDGYRLDKPDFAPEFIYKTMNDCWNAEPSERPDFSTLAATLGNFIEEGARQYYLDLNEPFEEQNNRDPNYNKLGEILEKSMNRGDDFGDLSGLPAPECLVEDDEFRKDMHSDTAIGASDSETSDVDQGFHDEEPIVTKLIQRDKNGSFKNDTQDCKREDLVRAHSEVQEASVDNLPLYNVQDEEIQLIACEPGLYLNKMGSDSGAFKCLPESDTTVL